MARCTAAALIAGASSGVSRGLSARASGRLSGGSVRKSPDALQIRPTVGGGPATRTRFAPPPASPGRDAGTRGNRTTEHLGLLRRRSPMCGSGALAHGPTGASPRQPDQRAEEVAAARHPVGHLLTSRRLDRRVPPPGGSQFKNLRLSGILATLEVRTQQASTEKYDNILFATECYADAHGTPRKHIENRKIVDAEGPEKCGPSRLTRAGSSCSNAEAGMTAWSPLEDQCSRGAGDLDREPQFTLRPALT